MRWNLSRERHCLNITVCFHQGGKQEVARTPKRPGVNTGAHFPATFAELILLSARHRTRVSTKVATRGICMVEQRTHALESDAPEFEPRFLQFLAALNYLASLSLHDLFCVLLRLPGC